MNLLATVVAQASNNTMPYQSTVHADHTVYLPPQDVVAVAMMSNYQLPHYPNDVFVEGYNPDPPLNSGAHAYVSRYSQHGSLIAVDTLSTMNLMEATNLQIDACSSVTFTAYVFQGWMAMVGMVFTADPGSSFKYGGGIKYAPRVVFDGATGHVHRISETMVLPGASTPAAADLDADALDAARRRAGAEANLQLLVTEERPHPGHSLRVDLSTGRLVGTPPRNR